MKIFVLTSDIPCRAHGREHVTALHIVTREIIGELEKSHQITLQVILPLSRKATTLSAAEQEEISDLSRCGITVLPLVFPDLYRPSQEVKNFRIFSLLLSARTCLEYFYPASRLQNLIRSRIRQANADVVFPLWSVDGCAATDGCGVPRMVYQGDIDFEPRLCRLFDRDLFLSGSSRGGLLHRWLTFVDQRLRLWLFKHTHIRLMRRVDSIANVTACNAEYYASKGHPRSFYIGNTWSDPGHENLVRALARCTMKQEEPIRVIGHIGYLNRTGAIYGLRCLLRDVLPHLPKTFSAIAYDIDIIGGGSLPLSLQSFAMDTHVRMRGFVENLDAELAASDVFLLLNNAGRYQAAYTRHLVAWSMGLCLIVHSGSLRAMPEIVHGENALVGSSGEEIAKLIALAAMDPALNRRIREGGRRTYERCFTPSIVAKRFSDESERLKRSL